MLALPTGNKKAALWSETHLEFYGFGKNQMGPADKNCP